VNPLGAIEQDIIVFIYRDEVYNPESEDKGTASIGKHHNGALGTIRLALSLNIHVLRIMLLFCSD